MVAAVAVASPKRTKAQSLHEYLAIEGAGKAFLNVPKGQIIFRQGEPADNVFHIQKGRVKVGVISKHGKEATLALRTKGDFIGEECLAGSQPSRLSTATAILPCTVLRIDTKEMARALAADTALALFFQSFLLTRCVLMQADLIDHLFNSSEKRLARTVLLLAQLEGEVEGAIPHTTQETLAEMVGTTRSRVSFFMNRFRRMGYIQYNGRNGEVRVFHSLFNVLLKD